MAKRTQIPLVFKGFGEKRNPFAPRLATIFPVLQHEKSIGRQRFPVLRQVFHYSRFAGKPAIRSRRRRMPGDWFSKNRRARESAARWIIADGEGRVNTIVFLFVRPDVAPLNGIRHPLDLSRASTAFGIISLPLDPTTHPRPSDKQLAHRGARTISAVK